MARKLWSKDIHLAITAETEAKNSIVNLVVILVMNIDPVMKKLLGNGGLKWRRRKAENGFA
jgi:hypothetical protein